ncbi:LacI family DNA-binding transcriptional regulator [Cerasicoccus frondis]|uniref:LacI family DNA-binding transcriptional regulator n=1 Tax=Cerasicoccus frondis TaxID=490090 RepID=UPI0028526FEA|nr:LacI family DNA-binding transcriptional regulator [Cerasicoccus frondis]
MFDHRPTQKEIAKLTQLTQATVSMALADNPRVSKATRKRVQKVANELGYRPDPHLTALSTYRKRSTSAKYQATLAWLVNDPDNEQWKRLPAFYNEYYLGAIDRAKELGYQLEEHQLQKDGMSGKRLASLLWARNIPGILLAPQAGPNTCLDFDFSQFSAVTFGHSLQSPELHTVVSHQAKSMTRLMRHILDLGYQRPGLALSTQSDQRTIHNWSSAFWGAQQSLKVKDRLPIHTKPQITPEGLAQWLKRYRPDVVVTEQRHAKKWLLSIGEQIPETLGLAIITIQEQSQNCSGILENSRLIGARAIEFLVDLLHRRECGVPEIPMTLMIDGKLVEGETLRCQA